MAKRSLVSGKAGISSQQRVTISTDTSFIHEGTPAPLAMELRPPLLPGEAPRAAADATELLLGAALAPAPEEPLMHSRICSKVLAMPARKRGDFGEKNNRNSENLTARTYDARIRSIS